MRWVLVVTAVLALAIVIVKPALAMPDPAGLVLDEGVLPPYWSDVKTNVKPVSEGKAPGLVAGQLSEYIWNTTTAPVGSYIIGSQVAIYPSPELAFQDWAMTVADSGLTARVLDAPTLGNQSIALLTTHVIPVNGKPMQLDLYQVLWRHDCISARASISAASGGGSLEELIGYGRIVEDRISRSLLGQASPPSAL